MNHQRIDFEEQRPQLRSIALHQAFRPEPTLQTPVALPGAPKYHFRMSQSRTTVHDKEQQQQQNPEDCKSFDRLLNSLSPKEMPEFLILGQSTISFDGSQQSTILRRVCEFIQKCSLDFQVYPEEGRIDCRAPCFLSFCLFLWKNEENDHIVVELQRRQGCGVLMQRYRKALTDFLQTGADFDPRTIGGCPDVAPHVKAMYEKAIANHNDTETPASLVGQCHGMMEGVFVDQKQLAMENLYLLLNSTAVEPGTIHKVANAILWGRSPEGHTSVLDELSFCLMGNQKKRMAAFSDDSCDFEEHEYAEGHYFGVMHNIALRVLSASLTAARPNEMPPNILRSSTWRTVLGALCYNISQAETRPQEAALSAHCLVLLDQLTHDNTNQQDVLDMVMEDSHHEIVPCLLAAQSFARRHNETLHRELSDLLDRVQAHT
mmetsp:Transcript_3658/g.9161  ORF Transcript_3658/g.9161 Transcript_3658/m.9161 type:complete len:432 (-) Transcript_3658:39-1334(-)